MRRRGVITRLLAAALIVTSVAAAPVFAGTDQRAPPGASLERLVGADGDTLERQEGPQPDAVQTAVDGARNHLLSTQRNAHWASNVTAGRDQIWDVRFSLYYAVMLEDLETNQQSKQEAIEWALSQREPNAGWNDTVSNYAFLLLVEMMETDRYDETAREIERASERKGITLVNKSARTDTSFVEDNLRLKLLYALKSDRYTVEELFGGGSPATFAGLAQLTPAFEDGVDPNKTFVVPDTVDLTLSMTLMGLAVQNQTGQASENVSQEMNLTANLLLGRRLPNGVWATTIDNTYIILALHQQGYDADDPEVARAIEQMRTTRQADDGRVLGFKLPVWDTAWSIDALIASGMSPQNDSVKRAAQWLYGSRVDYPTRKRGDTALDRLPLPFRKHWGDGWGYKPHMYSDWDDTSVAAASLAPYEDQVVEGDIDYLFTVQNSNGSWSAFMTDFSPLNASEKDRVIERGGRELYVQLFTNHPAPDVTGHALYAVGRNGYSVESNESVQAAVQYLLSAQESDGTWDAVWGRSPTYGTSRALLGMRAVGADMDRPAVERATDGLMSLQNDDGGWGLNPEAASDPTYTAWGLQALLAAGVPADHPAVVSAVQYLLSAQRADGSWETTRMMHNLRRLQYSLSVFTQASVLLALSMYAEAAGIPVGPAGGSPGPFDQLDPWMVAVLAELVLAGGALAVVRRRVRR